MEGQPLANERKSSLSYVGRRSEARSAGPFLPRDTHLLSPPEFPRARSAGGRENAERLSHTAYAPQEEAQHKRFCPKASPAGRYPRRLVDKFGQRPVIHRAHPSALMGYSLAPAGSSQMPPGRGRAFAGTVLRWLVPLTLTPRQTVGSHAITTLHELELGFLCRLPREGA